MLDCSLNDAKTLGGGRCAPPDPGDLFERTINDDVTMRSNVECFIGHIDQYDLIRELGGGGFGSVYLARDSVAGIDVAVKGLPPIIKNNAEELERIRENFALVSRLHHPYIAAALHLQLVRDVAYASEDVKLKLRVMPGDTLMVMEYAPGVTLSRWRKQFHNGRVPFELAVQIAWQVAQALDYAHEQHIIHRDVKPSNIMVETKPDGEVVARLLDFGLAAEMRSSMGRISLEIHDTSGTRPYMAPEQWAGRKQGSATDQYALAVMLCELLTGEVPFASVFETDDPIIMMTAICSHEAELPNECPRQQILLRALAKNPAERFASCMEFVEVLANGECLERERGDVRPERGATKDVLQRGISDRFANYILGHKIGLIIVGCVFLITCGVWGLVHRQRQLEKARRHAEIIVAQQMEAERISTERKAKEKQMAQEKERHDGAKRRAEEESRRKADSEHKKSEMTLKFISLFETKKYDEAVKLINFINTNNAEVQFNLAKMYENGWGVGKDYAVAMQWYLKSAKQGYGKAQNNLGVKYENGVGVAKDVGEAMFWFRKAAEQGLARSQSNVGLMYRDGKGVKKNYQEAMRWFRKAAEQGDVLALLSIGVMYLKGWGCEQDSNEAVKWIRKAVQQDDPGAQYSLGKLYENGCGVEKNLDEAKNWYRKAAEQGNLMAQKALEKMSKANPTQQFFDAYNSKMYTDAAKLIKSIDCSNAEVQFDLGYMYEYGKGVTKDYAEALKWYRKSSDQDLAAAQFNLGTMYAEGKGVAKDMTEAVRWYSRAAKQGYAAAPNNLGLAYQHGDGIEKNDFLGVLWYRKAADQGFVMAMNNLGLAYANGCGVGKDDAEAVRWYRKAAEQGYAPAQYHLGLSYDRGSGVAQNDREAVRWYRKAAEQGDINAQCNLGVCYAYGRGVVKDYGEAMRWYKKAAEQGDAQSQFNLGVMLHFGFGVAKDKREAINWYTKAAEQGHSDAKKNLKAIISE